MRTTFKALEVGQQFRFIRETGIPFYDLTESPDMVWKKISPRKYRWRFNPEGRYEHQVGSVNVEVDTVEEE